jgi:hypothetical protein
MPSANCASAWFFSAARPSQEIASSVSVSVPWPLRYMRPSSVMAFTSPASASGRTSSKATAKSPPS